MKKNIKHLKTNWLLNFSYIESYNYRFGEVSNLVKNDRFQDALKLLDSIHYAYADHADYQYLRNSLINLAEK